jgi:hypothetical protein
MSVRSPMDVETTREVTVEVTLTEDDLIKLVGEEMARLREEHDDPQSYPDLPEHGDVEVTVDSGTEITGSPIVRFRWSVVEDREKDDKR